MKRVLNHPAADAELVAEATYLEQQLPGCGALFLASVATLREIKKGTDPKLPKRFVERS